MTPLPHGDGQSTRELRTANPLETQLKVSLKQAHDPSDLAFHVRMSESSRNFILLYSCLYGKHVNNDKLSTIISIGVSEFMP